MFTSVYQQIRFAQSAIPGDFIGALWWLRPHFCETVLWAKAW